MNRLHHRTRSISSHLSECIDEIEALVRASDAYMEDLLPPDQEIFCELAEESLREAEMALAMGDAEHVGKHLEDLRAYLGLACQCQILQEAEEAGLFSPSTPDKAENRSVSRLAL